MSLKIKSILMVVVMISGVWMLLRTKIPVGNNVKVHCHYMAYACGDCYPQYHVKSVDRGYDATSLLERDIHVAFRTADAESKFSDAIGTCVICYDIELEGVLYKRVYSDDYTLEVRHYRLKLRPGCCPKEDVAEDQ